MFSLHIFISLNFLIHTINLSSDLKNLDRYIVNFDMCISSFHFISYNFLFPFLVLL